MSGDGRIRVAYIVAMHVRWIAFEWIVREIDRERFDISFILLNDGEPPLAPYLRDKGIVYHHIQYRGKRELPRAIREVYRYCRRNGVEIVHTHFMNACLAGLTGALLAGVRTRIHTRHHAGPFPRKERPRRGWFYDRYNNLLSTHIVAIDRLVRRVLLDEGAAEKKLSVIYHGFDIGAFGAVDPADVAAFRSRHIPEGAGPVVGVVARYKNLKGVQYIIPAFACLLKDHPRALLILANAQGPDTPMIRALLADIPRENYLEIPFEDDLYLLYRLFDLFVHVPIARHLEAFGQVYVEALAAGVPSVVTSAGIAEEIIEHGRNGWVVGFRDSDAILKGMQTLLGDDALRASIVREGLESIGPELRLESMVRSLERLYIATSTSSRRAYEPERSGNGGEYGHVGGAFGEGG
ncbi:MAG: glycosyltransferase family 4 protein [Candidatus Kapaibacterium sp.]